MALLADFGTTWTKLWDTRQDERRLLRTRELPNIRADVATGHNAARRAGESVNELIALAQGGLRLICERSFILLDVGSRDMKWVRFEAGRLAGMDWNTTCGALTGFTLELLGAYFGLDWAAVAPAKHGVPVTCGVLGMEQVFEQIASGIAEEAAIARFAKGLAQHAHRFAGAPGRLYLSGGMCDNPLFLASFSSEVEVAPLGRFVLVEGLVVG